MRIYMQKPAVDNCAPRYYQLLIQKDLLGGWSLIVESGEQGRTGRMKKHYFEEWDGAESKMLTLRDAQIQRGYKVMFIHGQGQPGTEQA